MKNLITKKNKSILLISFILVLSSCGKENENKFDADDINKAIQGKEAITIKLFEGLVLNKEDLKNFMGDGVVEAGDGPLSIIIDRDAEFYESFVTCVKEGESLWGVNLEVGWYGTSYLKVEESIGSIKAASSLAYKTNKNGFVLEKKLIETGECLIKPMKVVMDSIAKAHKGPSTEVTVSEIKPISIDKNIYALKFTSTLKTDKFGIMPVNLYYIISYKNTYLVENFIVTIDPKDNSETDTDKIMALVENKYDAFETDTKSESSLDKEVETPSKVK
jgi:hypothetical protein